MWNYRVWKIQEDNSEKMSIGIFETYYNKDGSIWARATKPYNSIIIDDPLLESDTEIHEQLLDETNWLLEALARPMLIEKDFQYAKPDWKMTEKVNF